MTEELEQIKLEQIVDITMEEIDIFSVGQTFPTFEMFEELLRVYEETTFTKYWRRDSRTIEHTMKRLKKHPGMKKELVYGQLTYCCKHGGRGHVSRSRGERPRTSTYRQSCPAKIVLKASGDGNYLIITELQQEHNHLLSKSEYEHLPSQRKLTKEEKLEAIEMLRHGKTKKEVKQHFAETSGKVVLSKDLNNAISNKPGRKKRKVRGDQGDQIGSCSTKVPKIYTKTGDRGSSATFTGERRLKDDVVFEALGETDELSCHLGMAREYCNAQDHPFSSQLQRVQCVLQDIGSNIATPKSSAREAHITRTRFNPQNVTELEEWIDEYSSQLPPLTNFVLPSGGKTACTLHLARSVCRRVERRLVPLVRDNEMDKDAYVYINRLSDYLFTVARAAAAWEGREEIIYLTTNEEKET